jgi:hypothetical protein
MLPIEYGTGTLASTRLLLKNWHYLGNRDLLTPAPDVLVTDSEGCPCFVLAIALWCRHAFKLFDEACKTIGIGYYLF